MLRGDFTTFLHKSQFEQDLREAVSLIGVNGNAGVVLV